MGDSPRTSIWSDTQIHKVANGYGYSASLSLISSNFGGQTEFVKQEMHDQAMR